MRDRSEQFGKFNRSNSRQSLLYSGPAIARCRFKVAKYFEYYSTGNYVDLNEYHLDYVVPV